LKYLPSPYLKPQSPISGSNKAGFWCAAFRKDPAQGRFGIEIHPYNIWCDAFKGDAILLPFWKID